MNILFISPNFPPNYRHFCVRLRARGARVFAIGDTPFSNLDEALQASLTGYYCVSDMSDLGEMGAICHDITRSHGPIDAIDSLNEHWLDMEAQLRRTFGVRGLQPSALHERRRKLGMKARFKEAGIPCAPGEAVVDFPQMRYFGQQVGYPLVIKPDIGVGASGAFKVRGEAEVVEALRHLEGPHLVEPYVEGDVVSFDGLTDQEGRILFHTVHVNCDGVMEILAQGQQTYYYSERDIDPALVELGRRVVEAFEFKGRFFHVEFFRQPDGEYVALEVNLRPPGGFSLDMMNYGSDIDLYDWWAAVILGQERPFDYERRYHVAHVARRKGLQHRHHHDDVLRRLGPACLLHRAVPGVFAEAMGDYVYLIREADFHRLMDHIAFIQAVV